MKLKLCAWHGVGAQYVLAEFVHGITIRHDPYLQGTQWEWGAYILCYNKK